jgi:hypothetical protein
VATGGKIGWQFVSIGGNWWQLGDNRMAVAAATGVGMATGL